MPANTFTDEQRDKALKHLVLADRNVALAKRRLEAEGISISERTLREWRNEYASRIAELQEQRAWVVNGTAESLEGQIADLIAMNQKFIDAAHDRGVKEGDNIASIGKSIQSNNVSLGILIDKVQLLRGKPTSISEKRDFESLLKALEKYPGVIESTAQEVTEQPQLEESDEPKA